MSGWSDADLSRDAFLGGALHLWQPKKGYRAGVDPVLLAASVPARAGQEVLDLGCGAGAAALCLGARVPGVRLSGLERQAGYADLARRNGAEARAEFTVFEGDVAEMPPALRQQSFDHVMINPPYFDRSRGSPAPDPAREAALGEAVALTTWVAAAVRRLRPRGWLHMIQKAPRLADLLAAMQASGLGSITVQPLAPRAGRAAELVLCRGRKTGRGALVLNAPILLHEGTAHPGDREHYRAPIAGVLRRGMALEF